MQPAHVHELCTGVQYPDMSHDLETHFCVPVQASGGGRRPVPFSAVWKVHMTVAEIGARSMNNVFRKHRAQSPHNFHK